MQADYNFEQTLYVFYVFQKLLGSKIITLIGCCLARQMAGQPLRALGLAQEKEVTTSLYSRVWLIWGSKPPKNNFYRRPLDKHVYTLGYPLQKNRLGIEMRIC